MLNLASASPLEKSAIRKIQLSENTALGLIRFQIFNRGQNTVENFERQLKMQFPSSGEITSEGNMRLFWCSPGEWIITVPVGTEQDVIDALNLKLNGLVAVLKTVTDSQTILELYGKSAREVLSRGSTADFCPARFGSGQCLNTRFAGVPAMLACPENDEKILLLVDRSLADYLMAWFHAASI